MPNVSLPIPPSTNHLWRVVSRRVVRSRRYAAWRGQAADLLRMQLPRVTRYPVAVQVTIHGGRGWRADRDLDNVLKAVLDALVASERLVDDSTQYVRSVRLDYRPPADTTADAACLVSVEAL
jgi:Holliday junction resolvase RusA-like endonuclease